MKIEIVIGSGVGMFAESVGEEGVGEKPVSQTLREAAEKRWHAIVPRVHLQAPQFSRANSYPQSRATQPSGTTNKTQIK